MKQSIFIVLYFLSSQIQAQCIGFVDVSYDSLTGHEIFSKKDSLFIVNAIKERQALIDKTYDSIFHFGYNERKFCIRSEFCKEINEVDVEVCLKNGTANKVSILANTTTGKLLTQYYYWEDKMFAFQSFEYLFGKAPKGQWVNANGVAGWEAETFVCDWEIYSGETRGVKEPKWSIKKWLNLERYDPLTTGRSNSQLIMQDLLEYSERIISEYIKTKKGIDIDRQKKG